MVRVTSTYTILGRLWSMCQAPWRSHVPGRRYKQGNSLRCEIRNGRRTWVLGRLWSKWHRHIPYWVASEVYDKSHADPWAMDGATITRIPSNAKLERHDEGKILHVSGQSDVEIYIIGSTLKYVPSTMMDGWLRTEIYAGEFPKMWNVNYRHLNIIVCYQASSCAFLVKVMLKYTLLGRLWSICQVPWRTVPCGRSYNQGNSLRCEIRNELRRWDLGWLWSKWCWNIHYWVDSEVYAKPHHERLAVDGATSRGISSDAKLESHDEHEILHVSSQRDVEIYIIRSTLRYMPSTMTNGCLQTELRAGEFPQMRN